MALATAEQLLSHLRIDRRDIEVDAFDIWNEDVAATTKSVEINLTSLILTHDGDVDTIVLSAHASLTALLAAITALGHSWVYVLYAPGDSDPTDLSILPSTSVADYSHRYPLQVADMRWMNELLDQVQLDMERYCYRKFEQDYYMQEVYSGDGSRMLILRQYPVEREDRDPITVMISGFDHTLCGTLKWCDDADGSYELAWDATNTEWSTADGPWGAAFTVKYDTVDGRWEAWSADAECGPCQWTNSGDDALIPPAGNWDDGDCGSDESTLTVLSYVAVEEYNGSSWSVVSYSSYQTDYDRGIVWMDKDYVFSEGYVNYRVSYKAGLATIPEDLRVLCLDISAQYYYKGGRDPMLKSDKLGSYSRSFFETFLGPGLLERLNLWARWDA